LQLAALDAALDVWDGVDMKAAAILCEIMATGRWDKPEFHRRAAVT
jgi:hypothetical protein